INDHREAAGIDHRLEEPRVLYSSCGLHDSFGHAVEARPCIEKGEGTTRLFRHAPEEERLPEPRFPTRRQTPATSGTASARRSRTPPRSSTSELLNQLDSSKSLIRASLRRSVRNGRSKCRLAPGTMLRRSGTNQRLSMPRSLSLKRYTARTWRLYGNAAIR